MDKTEVISKITETGLVAVIRADTNDEAKKIVDACIKGGVKIIEITFTVPGAVKILEEVTYQLKCTDTVIGAGTVMDSQTARIAILAGAKFIVSPYLNKDVVKLCNRYGVLCIPGAMTIKEVVEAMETGAEIIKIFPGDLFGPKIIKAVLGPIPHVKLMPTGGVDAENVNEWIKAGAVAVGAGSSLTKGSKTGDYEKITRTAEKFSDEIKKARLSLER